MTNTWNGMRRAAWGAKKRAENQSEKQFQQQVEDLATLLGWWSFHVYNASRSPAGFTDLVLFRERVIFAELKVRDKKGKANKLKAPQIEMSHRCFKAGAEWYSWLDPDDWPEIKEVLSRGGTVKAT